MFLLLILLHMYNVSIKAAAREIKAGKDQTLGT